MNRAEQDIDIKVFKKFFNDGETNRVFVDVGAARPDFLSISALYRKEGWRVIAIEPNPEFAKMHRDLGHEIYEYACGTENKDNVEFCIANSHAQIYEGGNVSYESFSSLSLKEGYKALLPNTVSLSKTKVKVRRLENILKEAGVEHIDVISADVEGWELEVLDGIDLSAFNPSVVILENFLRDRKYKTRLKQLGYKLWKELFPNQVFIRPVLFSTLPFLEQLAIRLNIKFDPTTRH
jgi:FkbM family methyltransferase